VTAEILSQSLHQPYQITEALREYDCGILEDKSDEASWKLHREIFEDWTLQTIGDASLKEARVSWISRTGFCLSSNP